DSIPVFPLWAAAALWIARAAAGAGLAFGLARTWAARLAAVALAASLTQTFQNQKALQLVLCAVLRLEAADPELAPAERKSHPVVWLLRCQLLIVYLFSAAAKLVSGFLDGAVLSNSFAQVLAMQAPGSVISFRLAGDGALAPRVLLEWLARLEL